MQCIEFCIGSLAWCKRPYIHFKKIKPENEQNKVNFSNT